MTNAIDSVLAYAAEINNINNNPFFKYLLEKDRIVDVTPKISTNSYFRVITPEYLYDRDVRLGLFVETQKVFKAAVEQWPVLLANCLQYLTPEERMVIVRNLWDEHGNGNVSGCHTNTYQRYLDAINSLMPPLWQSLDMQEIDASRIAIADSVRRATHDFIANLKRLSKEAANYENTTLENTEVIQYIAVLGMIEYTYITVSKNIHNYVSQYIDPAKIEHYSLHEILDESHSRELFELIADKWNYGDTDKKAIMDGIKKGYELFNILYAGYYNAIKSTSHFKGQWQWTSI